MQARDDDRFLPALRAYVNARAHESGALDSGRREVLVRLAERVVDDHAHGRSTEMVFVCTHNSRRSHFGQVWAQVAAWWFGFDWVKTYSGGTEATAFDPRAVAALERAGLQIRRGAEPSNPVYVVRAGEPDGTLPAMACFSKRYDAPDNPRQRFVAVMTCAQADADCPVVHGADLRIALPYDDPKAADGTDAEAKTYDERCAQIARELLFAFELAALSRDRTPPPGSPPRRVRGS